MGWRLSNSSGNCRNDRIFERPRSCSVTQWRKSEEHDVLLFAESRRSVSGRYGWASTWATASGESCVQGLADLTFVAISFCTIEMAKSSFQRVSGGAHCCGWIGNQGAEAECGEMAGSVVERYFLSPKIRRFGHGDKSVVSRILRQAGYWERS